MSTQAGALLTSTGSTGLAGPRPPEPGDSNSEWRDLDADLPVVTAALDELAHPLELRSHARSPELHWYHYTSDHELRVDIAVRPHKRGTTVGLCIRTVEATLSRR